jgi:hypothetical protein
MLVLQCCLCICNMFFIINWVDCLLSGMAWRRVFCPRSSLSLSDAILARGRNSLSNQATASIPLGSGNMVSSYGPPASVHSASEITQPLVSQLSNLPQVGNSVLKIFPIKHRPKMYIKFLKNRMKFCRG